MEENKTKSRSFINTFMMIFSIIVVLIFIPLVFMNGNIFEKFLSSSGVKISPNINDGYLVAEFNDPSGDILLALPSDTLYKNISHALDIKKFSVKKVEFSALSGIGIDPRLNLCFEFDGEQPNPLEFKSGFSFPVIHVYIKSPDTQIIKNSLDKAAKIDFEKNGWNYQIIIDGAHEQARVFDNNGKFLFNGLGLYLNHETVRSGEGKKNKINKTMITAGLPLKIIGDPMMGEWKYYVICGLLDVKNPSMLYQPRIDSSDVFDYVSSDSLNQCLRDSSGRLKISPLIVNYSKSAK
jgi:hypothetical protein